jgi:hypothetical protein
MEDSLDGWLEGGEKRKAARAFAVAASYLRGGSEGYGAPRTGMGAAMTEIGITQQAAANTGWMPCLERRCWRVAVIVVSILHQLALVRNS